MYVLNTMSYLEYLHYFYIDSNQTVLKIQRHLYLLVQYYWIAMLLYLVHKTKLFWIDVL